MEASDVPQSSSPEMVEMAEENCSVAEVTEISAGHEQSSLSSPSAGENEEKHLPADFERLWLATHENPSDFTSWTDLLQYCEQEVGDTRDKSFKTNTREQCFFWWLLLHCALMIYCRVRSQHLEEHWRPFLPAIHSVMATGKKLLILNDERGTMPKQRR